MHLASIAFCSEALLRDMALLHYRSQDILACTFSQAHGWAFVGLGGGRLLDGGSPPGRHGHRCRDCHMPHPEEPFRPARRWSTSGLCRHTRGRHSSEVTPAPPQGWTSEQDQSDTYHLSETGLIATLAVVYGLTSSPHVQTARQSGSTPTTARKPKSCSSRTQRLRRVSSPARLLGEPAMRSWAAVMITTSARSWLTVKIISRHAWVPRKCRG